MITLQIVYPCLQQLKLPPKLQPCFAKTLSLESQSNTDFTLFKTSDFTGNLSAVKPSDGLESICKIGRASCRERV